MISSRARDALSILTASGAAHLSTACGTREPAYTITSASSSAFFPFTVIRSGSPGPAPTKRIGYWILDARYWMLVGGCWLSSVPWPLLVAPCLMMDLWFFLTSESFLLTCTAMRLELSVRFARNWSNGRINHGL